MLQSRKHVTAEKISDRFGISVRTVYRDIRALDEIGIPVSFENNKGYFIVDGYFLSPVSFTADEANALVLLSSLADRFADVCGAEYGNRPGKDPHGPPFPRKGVRLAAPRPYPCHESRSKPALYRIPVRYSKLDL